MALYPQDAFRVANAINRLEGYEATDSDLELQNKVIRGELTFDEAVKVILSSETRSDLTH